MVLTVVPESRAALPMYMNVLFRSGAPHLHIALPDREPPGPGQRLAILLAFASQASRCRGLEPSSGPNVRVFKGFMPQNCNVVLRT
ncbi:hypothetical protein D3C79_1018780 [compost metagenome]